MNMQTFFNKVPSFINKITALATILVLFTSHVAFASSFKNFSAPQTTINQTEESILLVYNQKTRTQTLIFDPSYTGGSTLAAYFFVVPSKPTFFEAPKTTFTELSSLASGEVPVVTTTPATTPLPSSTATETVTKTSADDVLNSILGILPTSSATTPTIEQKPTITVPAVTSAPKPTTPASTTTSEYMFADQTKTITDWLVKKNLAYSLSDLQNFASYKTKPGTYLVAIKTTPSASVVGVTFTSNYPVLPIRLLADKAATTNRTLSVYTLSESPLYVPATKILVSKELSALSPKTYPSGTKTKDMDAVTAFSMKGKWLTQSSIIIDPKLITADLFMSIGTNKLKVASDSPVQVSAVNVKTSKAVVPEGTTTPIWDPTKSLTQAEIATDPTVHPYAPLFAAKRTLQAGLSGNDIKALQMFLHDFIDATIVPDGKWGPKTSKAVEAFQDAFNLKKDGRVGPQTRGLIELIPISEIIKRQQESSTQPAQVAAQASAEAATATEIPAAAAASTTPSASSTEATTTPTTQTTDPSGYSIDSLMNIIQGATGTTPDTSTDATSGTGSSGTLGSGPGGSIIGGGTAQ